jgi:hypothetical protein|tara:strand:+ start:1058 stop:1222 length:165 start_codon:yes stop_codon:yes gene_type:complete
MFERFIQNGNEPQYLKGKGKKKKEPRTLPKPGSYAVSNLQDLKKKVLMHQGGKR